jgi:hypothetical protein
MDNTGSYICNKANKHMDCGGCSHSRPHEITEELDNRCDKYDICYYLEDYTEMLKVRCIKVNGVHNGQNF